jgi:hypothetical protein
MYLVVITEFNKIYFILNCFLIAGLVNKLSEVKRILGASVS